MPGNGSYTIHLGKVLLLCLVVKGGISATLLFANDDFEEEREPVVWSVSFEGNDTFHRMVLREVIATSAPNFLRKMFGRTRDFIFDETELRRDRIRLMRYYERRGFHNIEVDFEIITRKKEWQKEVLFHIRERDPIRIASAEVVIDADETTASEISGSSDFIRAIEEHEFREGQRYETIRQPDVEGRFIQLFENLGYAWPEIMIETVIDSAANRADVRIVALPNSKTYFDELEIEGDLSVPERIVVRHTDIKKGEVYSRRKIQETQRRVFNHHLFRFVNITIPEQPRDSTLNLLIRMREYAPRSVQTSIGFGREELLRGQVNWQHRNISGTGHRLSISARASFIDQRFGTDYLIPYVFNPRSSYVTSVFGQHRLEPAFELFQAGLTNSLIYQIQPNKTVSASYEFTINEELSRQRDTSLPDTVLNYNTSSLSFSGYYSQGLTRDQEGWVVQPFLELSGSFGETTFTFQKLSVDVRRYTPLTSSLTFAARINTGTIFYTQPDSLPSNIRFFTGGTNSVRGWSRQSLGPQHPRFDEDGNFHSYVPVGGRAMFSFNAELRQQLNGIIPNFGIAAFLDAGQIWRAINRIDERPIQFGAGGGLRYQSPIGPIRVDVAYKLNPTDQDLNIYNGQDFGSAWNRIGIHFSIGQAF